MKRKRPAESTESVCDCGAATCANGQLWCARTVRRHQAKRARTAEAKRDAVRARIALADDDSETESGSEDEGSLVRNSRQQKAPACPPGATDGEHRAYKLMTVNHTQSLGLHVHGRDPHWLILLKKAAP